MILLRFEKHIKGSAKVDNYIDWIEVQTYALNTTRDAPNGSTECNSSQARISALMLTKAADQSSADLCCLSISGVSLGKATLHIMQAVGADNNLQPVLEIELSDSVISSWAIQGSTTAATVELISISFKNISYRCSVFCGSTALSVKKVFDLQAPSGG
ncbi:type VI secretion system tube protein Hcp [Pseudomonas sp. TH31]|uniref:type VI secretion system tube protein Hcp n=1 Tax=Pseudomonas sp. TH31 TaxID=2796396 RepID=UPI0019135827|nr:type VI secretion system tube protein Hcp [Pseudomonas sp. TH31]MBK5414305.1 type VI secretion system tube protein Hcp [Pseudomonas sp. TH31]